MLKSRFIAGVLFALVLPSAPALAQDLAALKSVSVELPDSDKIFPGGGAADAINNNCLACHSAEMVLSQPSFQKATWAAEVQKMITAYKAPIDPADVAPIVAYLAKTKGRD
jgi:hypothetical protein